MYEDKICAESMKKTLEYRTKKDDTIGDIYSGDIYQQHVIEGRLGLYYQISYSLCTDGVRYIVYLI